MKAVIVAAAGLLGSAMAAGHHQHAAFHRRNDVPYGYSKPADNSTCGCTTYTTTVYGQPTLLPAPTKDKPKPTPEVTTCPTPGTYAIPEKTVVITSTVTAPAATTTVLVPGEHHYGGTTTKVEASTTITYPYATVEPSGETYTTVVKTTTHVCPSAGEYTLGHTSTKVDETTTVVYPTITTYLPGTYTAPATTLTVTETSYVYVCPYSTIHPAPAPTKEAPKPLKEAPKPPKEEPAPYHPPAPPKPVKQDAPAPPKHNPPPKHNDKPSGGIHTNGKQWAMTYTPYTETGNCKDAAGVRKDLAAIKGKGFTTVRVYSTDCSALENIGPAAKDIGLRLILGAFIGDGGVADAYPQIKALANFPHKSIVDIIVIGNEAVFSGKVSMSALVALLRDARGQLKGAGYTCPITTTETLNILQESGSQLCDVVDVVGANIQPYFNAGVAPSAAGDFVKGQLDLVAKTCPGKKAYNLECGWPNGGGANGKAVTGYEAQRVALQSIMDKVGDHTVFFSPFNDLWKNGPVEKFWGCLNVF